MRSLGNVEDSLKKQLVTDYRTADIPDRDKLILEYAEKITREPAAISLKCVEGLTSAGFTDHELHDIVQVAAYFNYVNRLADGLGVELE